MKRKTRTAVLALVLVLALMVPFAALGGTWRTAEENLSRFRTLFDMLGAACDSNKTPEEAAMEAVLAEISAANGDDGDVARAVTEHWRATVLDSRYRMFQYRGEETAGSLKQSGLEFGKRHAFVVLGYQLQDGEMTAELKGRCDAAAAAARAFPDAMLICTGGATGPNNPEKHTEAGMMKNYLVRDCGIDASRIYTDPYAMTTMDNAVNVLGMMEIRRVDTYTLVTSDYHQRWAQVMFNAVAAAWEKDTGYRARLVGNYNYPEQPDAAWTSRCRSALNQVLHLFSAGVDTGVR